MVLLKVSGHSLELPGGRITFKIMTFVSSDYFQ